VTSQAPDLVDLKNLEAKDEELLQKGPEDVKNIED